MPCSRAKATGCFADSGRGALRRRRPGIAHVQDLSTPVFVGDVVIKELDLNPVRVFEKSRGLAVWTLEWTPRVQRVTRRQLVDNRYI